MLPQSALRSRDIHRKNWISPDVMKAAKTGGLLFVDDVQRNIIQIYSRTNPSKPIGFIVDLVVNPTSLTVDSSRNLYVSNTGSFHVILKFAPPYTKPPEYVPSISGFDNGGQVTVANDGSVYQAAATSRPCIYDWVKGNLENVPRQCTVDQAINGVALDAKNDIWGTVAGFEGSVLVEWPAGSPFSGLPKMFNTTSLMFAQAIQIDGKGNLVVANQKNINQLGTPGIYVFSPGTSTPAQTATKGLLAPYQMAFSPGKQILYVTDQGDQTVKILSYPGFKLIKKISGFGIVGGVAVTSGGL